MGQNDDRRPIGEEPSIAHDVELRPGEEIILSLADSHVLNEASDVVLEDTRLTDLTRFRKHTKERERIKDYKDRVGETGISTAFVEEDSDDEKTSNPKPLSRALKDDSSPNTTFITKPGERMASEEEVIKPTTAWVSTKVRAQPTSSDEVKTGLTGKTFKKRKIQESAGVTSWDEIFGQTNQTESSINLEIPTRPSWTAQPRRSVEDDDCVLETLDLIKKNSKNSTDKVQLIVKELQENPASSVEPAGDSEAAMIMSRTEEFAKALPNPAEKLQQADEVTKNHLAEDDLRRKGVINVTANSLSAAHTGPSPVISPEKGLEEIFNQNPLDGGLASALNYLKAGGSMEESRWSRHRRGGEELKPLIDEDGNVDSAGAASSIENRLKLDYLDAWGNVMNAKDAFRQMSYKFHGKGPGKKKTEKLLRRMVLEKNLKSKELKYHSATAAENPPPPPPPSSSSTRQTRLPNRSQLR